MHLNELNCLVALLELARAEAGDVVPLPRRVDIPEVASLKSIELSPIQPVLDVSRWIQPDRLSEGVVSAPAWRVIRKRVRVDGAAVPVARKALLHDFADEKQPWLLLGLSNFSYTVAEAVETSTRALQVLLARKGLAQTTWSRMQPLIKRNTADIIDNVFRAPIFPGDELWARVDEPAGAGVNVFFESELLLLPFPPTVAYATVMSALYFSIPNAGAEPAANPQGDYETLFDTAAKLPGA